MKSFVLFFMLALPLMAQVSFTGADYIETFDSMSSGTAAPTGWGFYGALGGSSTTWATSIPASGVGGGTLNATLTASTTFTTSSNTAGWNFALPASPSDRALGTSPTGGQGLVLQLQLTNSTASPINVVRIGYDIRRFTAATNQLPGYWLFYSVDGGTTWINATDLNPTSTTVPNTAGVSNIPPTLIALASAWSVGGELRLRWVDDNASDTSPDQIYGLDNVTIGVPIGQSPSVSLTAPAAAAAYVVGNTVNLIAAASDVDGTITKVEFYQGSTKLGEDTSAPFEYAWNGAAVGSYTITAKATDNDANVTTSSARVVYINATAGSGTLARGPYLQKAATTTMTVCWRSSQPIVGRVRYGLSQASLTSIADETAATADHETTLTGLSAGTTYFYSVGSATDTLLGDATTTFTTPPVAGSVQNTRFWVLGDAGTGTASQISVRDAFYTWTGSTTPKLVLQLGDNAYNVGSDSEFQAKVFDIYGSLMRRVPFWSCLGNHETAQATAFVDSYPYFSIYAFPTQAECGGVASGTEHYFSFDYANIHFISLDSMTASRSPTGAMAQWLTNDLAGVTATWIIAFFHHPPYTKGSHDSDTETPLMEMRANILPILEQGGVDLVLSGHSHSYERSYLLDGHYGLSGTITPAMKKNAGDGRPLGNGAYIKPLTGPRDHFGAVYAVPGSSGQISGGTLNHPAHFISLNNLGSLVLDVNGTRLDATFLRENGTTPDTFTILKQGAADTDGDGVADAFELANGMNRFSAADATLDTDSDGNNAVAEYLFDLNPAASDRFAWTTTHNANDTVISFATLPQRTYRVFWSADLLIWNPGSALINGDGTTKQWTDTPGNNPRRFYRLEVSPGP